MMKPHKRSRSAWHRDRRTSVCWLVLALTATASTTQDVLTLPSATKRAQTPRMAAARSTAQPTKRPSKCQRGECRIVLREMVSLVGDRTRDLVPDCTGFVIRDRIGRFYARTASGNQILVYDSRGNLRDLVGQRGRAAGQFERITDLLLGPQDTLLAYDVVHRTLTTIESDLKVTSSMEFPHRPSFRRDDGSFIVAQQIRSPDLIGHPIHLVDRNGSISVSFGADVPEYRPDLSRLMTRRAAPGPQGTVWTVAPGRYIVERWDPVKGMKLDRKPVRSAWAPAVTGDHPGPTVETLWEQDDLLWVLLRVADLTSPGSVSARPVAAPSVKDRSQVSDAVVEVVDPQSGDVIASRQFDRVLRGRPSAPFLTSCGSAEDMLELDVWLPVLERRESGR